MKILITGSSGHLGEALVREINKTNHTFVSIDIKPSKYTTHVGSITDREFVKECMIGVNAIIHTATLHKPHVATHSYKDFVDTNLMGTLNLLQEAKKHGVKSFIFTSTTSTYGDALTPKINEPANWITEKIQPLPKNIYGVTKTAAEDLCQLFYRNHKLPCLILKTSRFFPEDDDKKEVRQLYESHNSKANEFLYRRVDIGDVVSAHILAIEKCEEIGFGKYIISATSPFTKKDLEKLHLNAPSVVKKLYPEYEDIYEKLNWKMFPKINRVYINDKARKELGWKPKYDFEYILNCLKENRNFQSQLSIDVGLKGYHDQKFEGEPYPVNE